MPPPGSDTVVIPAGDPAARDLPDDLIWRLSAAPLDPGLVGNAKEIHLDSKFRPSEASERYIQPAGDPAMRDVSDGIEQYANNLGKVLASMLNFEPTRKYELSGVLPETLEIELGSAYRALHAEDPRCRVMLEALNVDVLDGRIAVPSPIERLDGRYRAVIVIDRFKPDDPCGWIYESTRPRISWEGSTTGPQPFDFDVITAESYGVSDPQHDCFPYRPLCEYTHPSDLEKVSNSRDTPVSVRCRRVAYIPKGSRRPRTQLTCESVFGLLYKQQHRLSPETRRIRLDFFDLDHDDDLMREETRASIQYPANAASRGRSADGPAGVAAARVLVRRGVALSTESSGPRINSNPSKVYRLHGRAPSGLKAQFWSTFRATRADDAACKSVLAESAFTTAEATIMLPTTTSLLFDRFEAPLIIDQLLPDACSWVYQHTELVLFPVASGAAPERIASERQSVHRQVVVDGRLFSHAHLLQCCRDPEGRLSRLLIRANSSDTPVQVFCRRRPTGLADDIRCEPGIKERQHLSPDTLDIGVDIHDLDLGDDPRIAPHSCSSVMSRSTDADDDVRGMCSRPTGASSASTSTMSSLTSNKWTASPIPPPTSPSPRERHDRPPASLH